MVRGLGHRVYFMIHVPPSLLHLLRPPFTHEFPSDLLNLFFYAWKNNFPLPEGTLSLLSQSLFLPFSFCNIPLSPLLTKMPTNSITSYFSAGQLASWKIRGLDHFVLGTLPLLLAAFLCAYTKQVHLPSLANQIHFSIFGVRYREGTI